MTKFTFAILLFVSLLSCRKTSKLSAQEKNFNPYKAGDTLAFVSNMAERDSIFVLTVSNGFPVPNQSFELFPDRKQKLDVEAKYSDPNPPDTNSRYYLTNSFISISKNNRSSTEVNFDLMTKDAWFSANSYDYNFLTSKKVDTLDVPAGIFTDVLEIQSNNGEFKSQSSYVKTIFWSKSTGYLRFDLLNGKIWSLEKKTAGNMGFASWRRTERPSALGSLLGFCSA